MKIKKTTFILCTVILASTTLAHATNFYSKAINNAIEIEKLQLGYTSEKEEKKIANIITHTYGIKLSALKNAIDTRGNYRNLQKLLLGEMDSKNLIEKIRIHIKNEAEKMGIIVDRKLLSDIDDTVYANIHDKRYPGKTVYPGVKAFYKAMGKTDNKLLKNFSNITFISARPKTFWGIYENQTHKKMINEIGFGKVTILQGDLIHLINHEQMAKKKLENFEEYNELYPEYDFVFVGDSGQGDEAFGLMLRDKYPERVSTIYIHNVNHKENNHESAGIYYFETYLEAALIAYNLGQISYDDLINVKNETIKDFNTIPFETEESKNHIKEKIDQVISQL